MLAFIAVLDGYTLADVLTNKTELMLLLDEQNKASASLSAFTDNT